MTHPGSLVGPYTIDRELGRGGMGVVYLAHDTRLARPVAIKALPPHLASDPDRLARFEREAQTLAQLSHPNRADRRHCQLATARDAVAGGPRRPRRPCADVA